MSSYSEKFAITSEGSNNISSKFAQINFEEKLIQVDGAFGHLKLVDKNN